jgi:hypothetical protein
LHQLNAVSLGHTHIDILKVDIERYEFETLTALIKPYVASGKPLPFGQLQLEIHLWDFSFTEFLTWWEMLEEAGLRPFWTEVSFSFSSVSLPKTHDHASTAESGVPELQPWRHDRPGRGAH